MQFMLRVEVTDVSDAWAVVADPAAAVPRAELAAHDGPGRRRRRLGGAARGRPHAAARLDTDHRTLPARGRAG
jgi:hypothetical protein